MINKTGQQIEKDVYMMFRESNMPLYIKGGVYRYGMRPKDSASEDAVIRFTGSDMDKITTGGVVITIYVPGLDIYGDGVMRCDKERCEDIEQFVNQWVNSLTAIRSGYRLEQERIVSTEQDTGTGEYFVSVRLKFRLV